MNESPFGNSSPWDEPAETPTAEIVKESPVTAATTATTAHTQEGVTLSFKGGTGYDASLLVLRAGTITEMDKVLEEEGPQLASLMKRAAKIQAFNTELNGSEKGAKAPSGNSGGPKNTFSGGKVQQSSDPGPGPNCHCGTPSAYTQWGKNKFDKPYRAFKCAEKVRDFRSNDGCDFIEWYNGK
ncbi:hypothetical protein ABZ369_02285 [Streptomyces sp. NPDC005918]|uniref:hypothetical protein n=1 Tax=Streptomyces sp. NPDC005918 TaxID=3155454 RepID=UPI0033D53D71